MVKARAGLAPPGRPAERQCRRPGAPVVAGRRPRSPSSSASPAARPPAGKPRPSLARCVGTIRSAACEHRPTTARATAGRAGPAAERGTPTPPRQPIRPRPGGPGRARVRRWVCVTRPREAARAAGTRPADRYSRPATPAPGPSRAARTGAAERPAPASRRRAVLVRLATGTDRRRAAPPGEARSGAIRRCQASPRRSTRLASSPPGTGAATARTAPVRRRPARMGSPRPRARPASGQVSPLGRPQPTATSGTTRRTPALTASPATRCSRSAIRPPTSPPPRPGVRSATGGRPGYGRRRPACAPMAPITMRRGPAWPTARLRRPAARPHWLTAQLGLLRPDRGPRCPGARGGTEPGPRPTA